MRGMQAREAVEMEMTCDLGGDAKTWSKSILGRENNKTKAQRLCDMLEQHNRQGSWSLVNKMGVLA